MYNRHYVHDSHLHSAEHTESIKADRKLLQRLLTAVTAERSVEMDSVVKHELSPVPLSLAKPEGQNSTPKADLISILMSGVSIPPEVPEADVKTCVLIDGHALIQTLGKPPGCQTFGDYADAFMRHVTHHF